MTILIQLPGGEPKCSTIEVQEHETTAAGEIAKREARQRKLPIGTRLVVNGEQWGVVDAGAVEAFQANQPLPGDTYRPKDPRRKSGFRIKAVVGDKVIADDGRTIQLDRMKRYERVG